MVDSRGPDLNDPFRPDAALVYRALRDAPEPLTAVDLAAQCFPLTFGPDDPLFATLNKRSLRRVYDSIVWMRHHNAPIYAVPTPEGTVFSLSPLVVDVLAIRSASVPDKVAEEQGSFDQITPVGPQDLWHGR